MKNNAPANVLDPNDIEGVLCAKYRAVQTAMITLSVAACIAALFLYSDILKSIPQDYISLAMIALLLTGWTYLWIERSRSTKRAENVSRILGAKFKPRYDAASGFVVLEAIEKLGFGGEETESVVDSVTLTREEARQLNDLIAMMKMKGTLALPFAGNDR